MGQSLDNEVVVNNDTVATVLVAAGTGTADKRAAVVADSPGSFLLVFASRSVS